MKADKGLFVETGDDSDIVLNWFGRPMEKFDSYAEAYRLAARRLLEMSSNKELRDNYASPVVFLYRHSLELSLKEILINGQKILQLETKPFQPEQEILNMKHDLLLLWNKFMMHRQLKCGRH